MLLINRSRSSLTSVVLPAILVVTFTILCSSSDALPAQRRTLGLVDRFIRANPLRALAKYLGRKLSVDLYYPPSPPPPQQTQFIHPHPQALLYVSAAPLQTHYTKIPALPPIYYAPTMTMIPPPQPQQPPVPQLVLHGISYHVPQIPQQHQYPTVVQVQSAVPPSYQPVVSESTYIPQQPPSVPIATVPQTTNSILTNEHHHRVQYPQQQQQQHPPPASYHVEPHYPSDNSLVTLPTTTTIVNSAHEINESPSGLLSLPHLPELSENVQMEINGYEDASTSEDMLKIFVIRPKDMDRMKASSEAERAELVKEYSTKYVDLQWEGLGWWTRNLKFQDLLDIKMCVENNGTLGFC